MPLRSTVLPARLLRPALIGLIASASTLSACTADSASRQAAVAAAVAKSSPVESTDPVRPRPQPWVGRPVAAAPPSLQADLQVLAAALGPRVIKPLMPAAELHGVVEVRLHPVEGVAAGSEQLITFGVPFPRGSITQAGLSKVRVLDARGQEIPAFVDQLTPWRHINNAALDSTSVRVARIQIRRALGVVHPKRRNPPRRMGLQRPHPVASVAGEPAQTAGSR